MNTTPLDTHEKALSINLDPLIFGSFAEIGAGQEVARWFLRVGAASGTVAKTVSAYDKEVSDDLYGTGSRYVSRERLDAMINREWQQLQSQLAKNRGHNTRFFSFANTVAARNFAGTNECHGWVGLRFQQQPGSSPNDILLHINLIEPSNLLQQEAVGVLGVNLIYGAFHQSGSPDQLLHGIFEDLKGRVEIDQVSLNGPAFKDWNERTIQIQLVRDGYAEAVIFPADRPIAPPSEVIRKKPIILVPGTFHHVEAFHRHMLDDAVSELQKEVGKTSVLGLFVLSTTPWKKEIAPANMKDFQHRIEELLNQKVGVLITSGKELYRTVSFAKRYTNEPIRAVVGLTTLIHVVEDTYEQLEGTRLEGIARLFSQNVRIYAYPTQRSYLQEQIPSFATSGWTVTGNDSLITANQIRPPDPLGFLYDYLLACKFIESLVASS